MFSGDSCPLISRRIKSPVRTITLLGGLWAIIAPSGILGCELYSVSTLSPAAAKATSTSAADCPWKSGSCMNWGVGPRLTKRLTVLPRCWPPPSGGVCAMTVSCRYVLEWTSAIRFGRKPASLSVSAAASCDLPITEGTGANSAPILTVIVTG